LERRENTFELELDNETERSLVLKVSQVYDRVDLMSS